MAEKTRKGAEETEKDQAAGSAEPSYRTEREYTMQSMRANSQRLFGVSEHIIVGAALDAKYDPNGTFSEAEMRTAIDNWLSKEVK